MNRKIVFILLTAFTGIMVKTSFGQSAQLSPAPANQEVKEIVIVFGTHFDIGYTKLTREIIKDYRTRDIDNALKTAEQNKDLSKEDRFAWTVPGWPMKKILENWQGQTPERKDKIINALKDGSFSVQALPFVTQTEMLAPEVLVRGLTYSANLMKLIHKPYPTGAKMSDVPEHSWILPTVLKNAGINFLHLGCNPGSAFPRLPLLFWWQGPDGSKLLTMYSREYGSSLLPPPDWHHKTWLAMIMRGDNAGPPAPEEVKKLLRQVHAAMPDVKVTVGRLSDFTGSILKENLSDLPVVRSDMPDTWIHGVMVDPANVSLSKTTIPQLFEANYLHTLLFKDKTDTAFQRKLNASYENSLLFYEHTWGGALYWIAKYLPPKDGIGQVDTALWTTGERWNQNLKSGKFNRLIESWEEHSDYERKANNLSRNLLNDNLTQLANAAGGDIVYNPLPWMRNGIPASGYKRIIPAGLNPAAANVNEKDTTLENRFFKIIVSPATGSIQSVLDKKTGKELMAQDAPYKPGQFLYERFSRNEVSGYISRYVRGSQDWAYAELGKPNLPPVNEMPYMALTPRNFRYKKESDTSFVMWCEPVEGGTNRFPVMTRIILGKHNAYFDIDLTVNKNIPITMPEAGWFCLPFNITSPKYRVGRNGSIIDPVKDINVKGVNRYMYAVGTGIALIDQDGSGVGICPLDAPLISLGEPGGWKFDYDYVPSEPYVFFNLFNNQWSTNYRLWNEGKWTYRFRIWSFDKYDNESALITPSLEALYPLQYGYKNENIPSTMPPVQSGIRFSRKGILVTTFG
ncbi:MAG TPA: hypothetical protein VIU45_08110, partial [Chitinophagaceae bacterium]